MNKDIDYTLIDKFYRETMQNLLKNNFINKEDKILICCAGVKDRANLLDIGFKNVTISNLDTRMNQDLQEVYAPYEWSFQDVENLNFSDGSFDLCIVHSGLHHCRNPQKAILEMYRVSKKCILAFEPHKSLFTKIGVKLGFGQQYEHGAVQANDLKYGGVANTNIPNFVYRFNKEMIVNTIQCANPIISHKVLCWYATRIPGRLERLNNPILKTIVKIISPLLMLIGKNNGLFSNNFAFLVQKPTEQDSLFPWLMRENNEVIPNKSWFRDKYQDILKIQK